MNAAEFKRRQSALGWTNARMASHLRKTPQSVSNYRNERQAIPAHVEVLMDAALAQLHAKAKPVKSYGVTEKAKSPGRR